MMKNFLRVVSIMIFAVAIAGCRESDERRHPLYVKALQDQQEGRGVDAAEKLCELLKRRPRSIYAHKLLASIYDEMLNDPANAVYHYQAYIKANPEASDVEEVKAWLTQAEKRCCILLNERFNKDLPKTQIQAEEKPVADTPPAPADEKSPAVDISETAPQNTGSDSSVNAEIIAAKDKEIAELKLKMAQYQARYQTMRQEVEKVRKQRNRTYRNELSDTPAVKSDLRQYKVVAGDTPGSIARKVYGKSSLYYVIMRANPQADARKLHPGMVLNIPQLKEKTKQGNAR